VVAGLGGALYALFTGPGGAYAEGAAPDPGSCPVNVAGAARDPDFLHSSDRLMRMRDPLLAEEPVVSSTEWIGPEPTTGRPRASADRPLGLSGLSRDATQAGVRR
jgi:hypothetical protein